MRFLLSLRLATFWMLGVAFVGASDFAPAPNAFTATAMEPPPAPAADTLHEAPRVSLLLDPTLCDGFDFPVGDVNGKGSYRDKASRRYHQGWNVIAAEAASSAEPRSDFTAETWNGRGGGATDAGQPVHAIASGVVRAISDSPDGQVLEIEHRFLENGTLRTAVSLYRGVNGHQAKVGDRIKRRQQIGVIAKGEGGTPTQLTLGIKLEGPAPEPVPAPGATTPSLSVSITPSAFIREHRKLLVPAREPEIFIAMKRDYRLYLFRKGKLVRFFPIALSQDPMGPKRREGDNRTPEGEYRITQKAKGPFEGEYGPYLGKAWIRISYPNAYDARVALAEGRITTGQCTAITSATNARKMPPAKTPLGGGVGIHGWASDWPDGPQDLTWGCLSLRHADLMALYDLMKQGALILIHP
jgi:hypothetical protein